MFKLGKRSLERLETCHVDLQVIMEEAISTSMVDFGVAEGHRNIARQNKLFKEGKSRIDGINKKGKHNEFPSEAVDIFAYYNGKAQWDDIHLGYLAGHILCTAKRLLKEGKVTHKLRSGGNWDDDGIFVYDHSLKDLPHYEIYK